MEQLIDFAGKNLFLVSAAVVLLVLAIVAEIRARIQDFAAVAPHDAIRLMNQGGLVIDVRAPGQYEAGHIGESRNIPHKELAGSAESLKRFKDKPVVTYCDTGLAGGAAARELNKLGFAKVFNLRGGFGAWQRDNLPVVKGAGKGAQKSRDPKPDDKTNDRDKGKNGKSSARA
jgi:rhodanese-related sulfurtransferase